MKELLENLIGTWTTKESELTDTIREQLENAGTDATIENQGEYISIGYEEDWEDKELIARIGNAGGTWYIATIEE